MKTLMTVALMIILAGTALAQPENSMGIFFSSDEFTAANTNLDTTPGQEIEAYIVAVNPTFVFVAAYEVGLEISDASVFVLGLAGPDATWDSGAYVYPDGFSYGGTNFGDATNQLVGYTYPVPTYGTSVVLGKMRMLYTGQSTVEFSMGPSTPSSVAGAGPAMANGVNPDDLVACTYTSGPDQGGLVATFNGAGIEFPVATEAHSLSSVKALFQ